MNFVTDYVIFIMMIYKDLQGSNCLTMRFYKDIFYTGGYWVNLGPLLYHFADQPGERSIEPSYEEVKNILTGVGFKITVSLFDTCMFVLFKCSYIFRGLLFYLMQSVCANFEGYEKICCWFCVKFNRSEI